MIDLPRIGALVALGGVALGLGGCLSSTNYGTGEAPEMAVINEAMGGLSMGKKKDPIDYQPRAPLVIPPSVHSDAPAATAALRAPQEEVASVNAEWPQDPDKAGAVGPQENETREEYLARVRPYASLNSQRDVRAEEISDRTQTWQQRRAANAKFRAAVAERDGFSQTQRRYLTEPPLDYRQPAGTAPAGEAIEPEKKGFFGRMFRKKD